MTGLTKGNLLTTRQVAEQLGTSKDVILANARKCNIQKEIKHGKATYWNEAEVTLLIDYMKRHVSNNASVEFNSTVKNTTTSMTPALKIKQAMLLMQEGYEEEIANLRAKNLEVIEENGQLKIVNRELSAYRTSIENKLANSELVEVPSENVRNHLWQNMQKIGTVLNDYRKPWHDLYELIKRDLSIDVKARAANQGVKPIDVISNLDIDTFNQIYAMSEKMMKELKK